MQRMFISTSNATPVMKRGLLRAEESHGVLQLQDLEVGAVALTRNVAIANARDGV